MRRFAGFVLLCCVVAPMYGYGPRGHRLVARIAARYLDEHTKAIVDKLLSGDATCGKLPSLEEKMACVSVWADEIRRDRPETYNWHFTDIPLHLETYDPVRDCPATAKGDCSIAALTRFRLLLGNAKASPAERLEGLKYLIHFLGDMHQPLHNVDDEDLGGNGKRVLFFGEEKSGIYTWNLHGVWDVGLLDKAGKSEEQHLGELLASLPAFRMPLTLDLAKAQSGSFVTWSQEGHDLARDHCYALLPPPKAEDTLQERGNGRSMAEIPRYRLGQEYVDANLPVVEQQLRRGGIRLARVLRESLRLAAE